MERGEPWPRGIEVTRWATGDSDGQIGPVGQSPIRTDGQFLWFFVFFADVDLVTLTFHWNPYLVRDVHHTPRDGKTLSVGTPNRGWPQSLLPGWGAEEWDKEWDGGEVI